MKLVTKQEKKTLKHKQAWLPTMSVTILPTCFPDVQFLNIG